MRIIGHGIDIIAVARIEQSLRDHPGAFEERVFTTRERQYAEGKARRVEHLAARFAAKEAVLKALGTGWGRGIAWTDVEVVPTPSGQPTVQLHGQAERIARELGITSWSISLTHTSDYAAASAIATGA